MTLKKKAGAPPSVPYIELGHVTITDAASAALEASGKDGVPLLARHLHGDWGDVTDRDVLQNELAVLLGLRVLSSYTLPTGKAIWIMTEANRSATTITLRDS